MMSKSEAALAVSAASQLYLPRMYRILYLFEGINDLFCHI